MKKLFQKIASELKKKDHNQEANHINNMERIKQFNEEFNKLVNKYGVYIVPVIEVRIKPLKETNEKNKLENTAPKS